MQPRMISLARATLTAVILLLTAQGFHATSGLITHNSWAETVGTQIAQNVGWCCIDGQLQQLPQRVCTSRKGRYFHDADEARRLCGKVIHVAPIPSPIRPSSDNGVCCLNGELHPMPEQACRESRGQFFYDIREAQRVCRVERPPERPPEWPPERPPERKGVCCLNGEIHPMPEQACRERRGQFFYDVREAQRVCRGERPPEWPPEQPPEREGVCCLNGEIHPMPEQACRERRGRFFYDVREAERVCRVERPPEWPPERPPEREGVCCLNGEIHPIPEQACRESRGRFFYDVREAERVCRGERPPELSDPKIIPQGPVSSPLSVPRAMPLKADLTNIQRILMWERTGGPFGGLGYDIRMNPLNSKLMYVTCAWAGVFRSNDGGNLWIPVNEEITVRRGRTTQAFPIFSLTIDPLKPSTIWVGTKDDRGIFRSDDGGEKWKKMDQTLPFNDQYGNPLENGITFRGFTVHPTNRNIVYASAEISSFAWSGDKKQRNGRNFDKTKGIVFKTTDGGKTWKKFWSGDNLARYILVNPVNPNVIYISTGIFDREAANTKYKVPGVEDDPGGVGIVKTTDGGKTWKYLNHKNGLGNLYVGTLFMHPTNPDILLAGTGCNSWPTGAGVYLTEDGGSNWFWTLKNDIITSVEFSTSNPKIAYAGSSTTIYRSDNGGKNWKPMTPEGEFWGLDGIRAGWPIDFQVDPIQPERLFANAYGGGNFLSLDGGATWTIASNGYTGAQIKCLATDPKNGKVVYASGRSGVFISQDAGDNWVGLNRMPASAIDWDVVAVDPNDSNHLLGASLWKPQTLFETHDQGQTWKERESLKDDSLGWRSIVFALSRNVNRVYAGVGGRAIHGQIDESLPGRGIYTSTDGGKTWNEANDGVSKNTHVVDLAVHPQKANIVYAATCHSNPTSPAGILKTEDNGNVWKFHNKGLPRNPRALSVALDPKNPEVVYAGLLKTGLYCSTDGGQNWKPFKRGLEPNCEITDIVIDPSNPNVLYVSDRMSGVYRRDKSDRISVFRKINSGLTNREVNALAISSDGKILYAGIEGAGVFRLDIGLTQEGGRTRSR